MKCSYHSDVESQEICATCRKSLCSACAHKIKGKPYCQDCLVQGTEWAATLKGFRLPADAPQRAAWFSLIPGMGAVYNNEYLKAITYFAVFAALTMLGSRVHGVFGFGAIAFLVFTMFDSYRTAAAKARKFLESPELPGEELQQDKAILAWGVFLIILGILFLLQNLIPYYFLNQLWPFVFIVLGGYLVYRALQKKKGGPLA